MQTQHTPQNQTQETFSQWMQQQSSRQDPVGDLSREYFSGAALKNLTVNSADECIQYLKTRGAPENVINAAQRASGEFRQYQQHQQPGQPGQQQSGGTETNQTATPQTQTSTGRSGGQGG